MLAWHSRLVPLVTPSPPHLPLAASLPPCSASDIPGLSLFHSFLSLYFVCFGYTTMACTAVGIDLGTTYSCVGIWKNDRVEIITNDQGNRTTPSYVAFTEAERLVGEAAYNQAPMNPENTVYVSSLMLAAVPSLTSSWSPWWSYVGSTPSA